MEFDDAALFAFKEARLPAQAAPNPLTRKSVTFGRQELVAFLTPLAGDDDALVVLEGVSMYLPATTLAETAATVRGRFCRER